MPVVDGTLPAHQYAHQAQRNLHCGIAGTESPSAAALPTCCCLQDLQFCCLPLLAVPKARKTALGFPFALVWSSRHTKLELSTPTPTCGLKGTQDLGFPLALPLPSWQTKLEWTRSHDNCLLMQRANKFTVKPIVVSQMRKPPTSPSLLVTEAHKSTGCPIQVVVATRICHI